MKKPWLFFLPLFLVGLGSLSAIPTAEDRKNLNFYTALFEKNKGLIGSAQATAIPKRFHLIWLGSDDFPEGSKGRLQKTIAMHPEWEFYFWTDIDRAPPHAKMKQRLVSDFQFARLEECYFDSDNEGEKSEILRFEILFQEGGVYLDHDVEIVKSVEPLQKGYDFFCGLEAEGPTVLSSSIFPAPHLIGSKPHHPVLETTLGSIAERWEILEKAYPGKDPSAIFYRVMHRVADGFRSGVEVAIDQSGSRDIVFPAAYFSQKVPGSEAFALHRHEGSWVNKKNEQEEKIERKLREMERKESQMMLGMIGLIAVNGAGLFILWRKRR